MKSDTNCSWYLTKCLDSRQEDNNKATTKRRPYYDACSCVQPKNTTLIRQKVSSFHVSLSVMSRVLFLVLWGESTVWTVNDVLSRSIPFSCSKKGVDRPKTKKSMDRQRRHWRSKLIFDTENWLWKSDLGNFWRSIWKLNKKQLL